MRRPGSVSAIALCLALGPLPALAQHPATTGIGGDATSTITAPNTVANGTTKPPGAAAGPGPAESNRTDRTKNEKADKIMQGICIGCGVK